MLIYTIIQYLTWGGSSHGICCFLIFYEQWKFFSGVSRLACIADVIEEGGENPEGSGREGKE